MYRRERGPQRFGQKLDSGDGTEHPRGAKSGAPLAHEEDLWLSTELLDRDAWPSPRLRDGSWTHGYGYPRVSYPVDMDTGRKTHPWVLSGRIPEIHRVGYG